MTKDTKYWQGVLKEAREQREALTIRRDYLDVEREQLNERIVQLEQLISTLAPFTSENPFEQMEQLNAFLIENAMELGLADAVREVLKMYKSYMTPRAIRDALDASGFDLTTYSNALASIHGVLKRMVESNEVEPLSHDTLGTLYAWKFEPSKAPTREDTITRQPIPGQIPLRRPRLGSADGGAQGDIPAPLPQRRPNPPPIKTEEKEKGKIVAPQPLPKKPQPDTQMMDALRRVRVPLVKLPTDEKKDKK